MLLRRATDSIAIERSGSDTFVSNKCAVKFYFPAINSGISESDILYFLKKVKQITG